MTKRRALAQLQYRYRQERRAKLQRVVLVSVVSALTLAALLAVAADRLFWPRAFPIQEVTLEGQFKHVEPEALRTAVVAAIAGNNFFSVDLKRLEAAAEALPWVYRATVRKVWSRGVRVTVEEQRPMARWGQDDWLNLDGEVLKLRAVSDSDHLVRLKGPAGTAREVLARYRAWHRRLDAIGLGVDAIELNSRYAWTFELRTRSNARFRLLVGRLDADARLNRFLEFYQRLTPAQRSVVQRIDVRYPNGVAVARRPGTQPEDDTT